MSEKHSPGPWRDHHGGILDATGNLVACLGEGLGWREREADARLIAAAPEMLALLREMLERRELLDLMNLAEKHGIEMQPVERKILRLLARIAAASPEVIEQQPRLLARAACEVMREKVARVLRENPVDNPGRLAMAVEVDDRVIDEAIRRNAR